MRILITGIGDAFTTRHFGSGALIEAPEGYVLIDCPDLVHRALRAATEPAGWDVTAAGIDDIILTHLHGDHCNGLESFGFSRRIMRLRDPDATRPRLHTIEAVARRLWERLAPAMDGPIGSDRPSTLEDFFDVRRLEPDGATAASVAGLSVRCRPTKHPIPTIGLLIAGAGSGEAGADGAATVGWSGDTPYDPDHLAWLGAAAVIVHESNLGPAHTPIEDLEALPETIRTKLRLIHLPDDFDPGSTGLLALREGEVVTV